MIDEENLTNGQKAALKTIMKGHNVFLTGGGGTGKSEVLTLAIQNLRNDGKSVIVCAPSGTAALRIKGVTIHKAFGFKARCAITEKGKLQAHAPAAICGADVIVIDEISMARMDLFDAVVQSIIKAETKTGKKIQLIVSGDFYQLPPVLKDGSEDIQIMSRFYNRDLRRAFAFQGMYWDRCKFYPIILTETVRQDDTEFIQNLNLLRTGDARCIDYFNSHDAQTPIDDAITLYARKKDVERKNLYCMRSLTGEPVICRRKIKLESGFRYTDIDSQVLQEIPETITLKEDTRIIFTATDTQHMSTNLSDDDRLWHRKGPYYTNGCGGKVLYIDTEDDLVVRVDNGDILFLATMDYPVYGYFVNSETGKTERKHVATVSQYPILPAYAMTIHRSQGQTYDSVNIDPDTFCYGQLYVAISRARSINRLHLTRYLHPSDLTADPDVKDFYSSLVPGHLKQGRPVKSMSGIACDNTLHVPGPLVEHVKAEAAAGHMIPLKTVPAYTESRDRKNVRIPSNLYNDIAAQIKQWKSVAKAEAKKKKGS